MPLITQLPQPFECDAQVVRVQLDRHTLARRRWRVVAPDGTDLAVDLETPCKHGDFVWHSGSTVYQIDQTAEPVLEIALPRDPSEAARLGWFLGNQHLPVEVSPGVLRLAANAHLAALLDRHGIGYAQVEAVFSPPPHSGGHHHHPPHFLSPPAVSFS